MESLWEQIAQRSKFERLEQDMKTDVLIIGGGMANTFLLAQGYAVGKSLVDEDSVDLAKELLADPSASISEVSTQCGYEDSYYFSKVF